MNTLLTKERLEEIQGVADEIYEKYGRELSLSDLISRILSEEKIKLKEADLNEMSGMLYFDAELSSWVMMVNSLDSRSRKMFTVAHELGHYFLHRNQEKQFIDSPFSSLSFTRSEVIKNENIEIEANEFAGNFLMPQVKIASYVGNCSKVDYKMIMQLANSFGVSTLAMVTRLKNLGYNTESSNGL